MLAVAAEDWKQHLAPCLGWFLGHELSNMHVKSECLCIEAQDWRIARMPGKACHQCATWTAQQTGYDPPAFHGD